MKKEVPKLIILDDVGICPGFAAIIACINMIEVLPLEPPIEIDLQFYKAEKRVYLPIIKNEVMTDLSGYILKNTDLLPKHKTIKFGGNSEPFVVDHPDAFDENGFRKEKSKGIVSIPNLKEGIENKYHK